MRLKLRSTCYFTLVLVQNYNEIFLSKMSEKNWDPLKILDCAVTAGQIVSSSSNGCGTSYAIILLNQEIKNEELFISLWNEASFRVLLDGAANHWRHLRRKFPDLLQLPNFFGHFSPTSTSVESDTLYRLQRRNTQVEIHRLDAEGDEDEGTSGNKASLKGCLNSAYLIDKFRDLNIPQILVYFETGSGSSLGEIMENLGTLYAVPHLLPKGINLFLCSSTSITFLLRKGKHVIHCGNTSGKHSFLKVKGCSLLPLAGPCVVRTKGLENDFLEGEGAELSFGKRVMTSKNLSKKIGEDDPKDYKVVVEVVSEGPGILWDMEYEFDSQLKNVW